MRHDPIADCQTYSRPEGPTMFDLTHWAAHSVFLADWLLRVGFSLRVIQRRLPVGVSLAWLAVILVFPFGGAIVYLFLGEYRLGWRRAQRAAAYRQAAAARLQKAPDATRADLAGLPAECLAVARLVETTLGAAARAGNRLDLLRDADAAFPALIAAINRAERSCDLEFYIWSVGGRADEVGQALARAAKRGV